VGGIVADLEPTDKRELAFRISCPFELPIQIQRMGWSVNCHSNYWEV